MSLDNTTYVGFTTDVERRLKQHNREKAGGARATQGKTWKRIVTVTGFPTKQSALQFEWKWKFLSKRISGKTPIERRCNALESLLNSEQSTMNAIPFCDYPDPLSILLEDAEIGQYLRDKEMRYGILIE